MADSEVILTTHGLAVGYRSGGSCKEVLSGLDVEIRSGEVTCLLGANGVGKSTLLRTLGRQQKPLAGRVDVCGRNVHDLDMHAVARMISVVYTERTHAGALTVEEVVALGRQPYTGFFGKLDDADRCVVADCIAAVGVSALSGRYMATLSDGERQKVMIARALAQQTPVMILDEPTSFLDVASRLEVMALLSDMAGKHGKAVLLSTHDIGNALNIADNLWLIKSDGHMTAGVATDLVRNGAMDDLFAGRNVRFDPVAGDYRISD